VIFGALQVTKVLSTEEAKRAIEGSGKDFGKSMGQVDLQDINFYTKLLACLHSVFYSL
jgi:hypothetical protein